MKQLAALIVALGLGACAPRPTVEFRAASWTATPGTRLLTVPGSELPIYVDSQVVITNADIASASLSKTNDGQRAVAITLTDKGAQKLGEHTGSHLDQPIAIFVDGKLYSAPTVRAQLTRSALIMRSPGGLSESEATSLVESLNK